MTSDHTPGILLMIGSLVFGVGAAVGVPGVFTQRDPQVRLRMLTERLRSWRIAQPLYGLGAHHRCGWRRLAGRRGVRRRSPARVGGCLPGAGHRGAGVGWSLYLRGTRISEFAFGTLPGWPFATYVLLTIGGLALLGAGLLIGETAVWLGWLTVGADVVFLAGYLRFKDVPPFAFYLLLLLVGVVVV